MHVSSANDIPEGTNKNKKSVKKFLYNKKARWETCVSQRVNLICRFSGGGGELSRGQDHRWVLQRPGGLSFWTENALGLGDHSAQGGGSTLNHVPDLGVFEVLILDFDFIGDVDFPLVGIKDDRVGSCAFGDAYAASQGGNVE